jgi:hypothetical protein
MSIAVKSTRPTFTDAVNALRPVFGELLLIRKVRGVRLRDGRELLTSTDNEYLLYDQGVQHEGDSSANLWSWDEISEVLI